MTEQDWLKCDDPQPMLDFIANSATERKLRLFAVACCRRIWSKITGPQVLAGHRFLVQMGAEDFSDLITPDCGKKAIEIAERYADRMASDEELQAIHEAVHQLSFTSEYHAATHPTGVGTGNTDYLLMAIGDSANAAAHASSFIERSSYVSNDCASAAAYFRCGPDDPVPEPKLDAIEQGHQAVLLREIIGNPFHQISFDSAWLTFDVVQIAKGAYEDNAFERLPILADALQDAGCETEEILSHLRNNGPHVKGCWALDLIVGKS